MVAGLKVRGLGFRSYGVGMPVVHRQKNSRRSSGWIYAFRPGARLALLNAVAEVCGVSS